MKKRYWFLLGTALAVSGIVLVGPAATRALRFADDPKPATTPKETPGEAALRVVVDPETGELTGPAGNSILSPEEQNALSTSDEGLVEVHHPDGSVSIDLQGRFQSATVAQVGPNGEVRLVCVDTPEQAVQALTETPTALTGQEEK